MSEQVLKNVNELLNQEKWTRATLNSYSINNFKELDALVAQIRQAKVEDEVKELSEEHLKHSKNSIIALYLAGIISLSKQLVDDSNLIMLIGIFMDNHKWNIVEYLCDRILEFGENKYALRTLAECYENENEEAKKLEVWERLIRVDYEEAEIVRHLAEQKEEQGDPETAIDYYKKALHRFINKKMFSQVRETWAKLTELYPDDVEFYLRMEKKVASTLSGERAATLLHSLYPTYTAKKDWDTAISMLKRILDYEPKNAEARTEIIECFRQKHADHSQLDEYVRLSNLTQNWRNVHEAITDFEKHISFDKSNYVHHRSWGIGRIRDIKDDVFVLDFAGKKGHKMSLKMAVGALTILGDEHIWVLKGTMKKADLREKVKTDTVWALKTIIRSFDNVADMKRIKAELVPHVLTTGEWTKWNVEARRVLKTDPDFGNLPEKKDQFVVRESPITFEEKTFNRFKAEKNFFGRVAALQEFLDEEQPDSEYFEEMFAYFVGFLKSFTVVTEETISSHLLTQRVVASHPYLNPGLGLDFATLYEQIEDVPPVFAKIEDSDLQKEFLRRVRRMDENWAELFSRLFRTSPTKFIIDELISQGRLDVIKDLFLSSLDHYRESREPFVWLVRNIFDEPWFAGFEVPFEKVLIGMIHLLEITYREIGNRRDVSLNRRLNKQIQDFLFKEERLAGFLMLTDVDSITRLYTLVDDVKELDPAIKIKLKQLVKDKYPDFKFIGQVIEAEVVSGRMLATRSGYEAKQRDLRHLLEVEVPENSRDIGTAIAKGDLRENAEYKAALEKQDMLNTTAGRLQQELQGARIFVKDDLDTNIVSFGTKVYLKNLEGGSEEAYTILGPWESEPSDKIISYLSPLGAHLYNHKLGEELKFTINEKEFHYKVDKIEAVELP